MSLPVRLLKLIVISGPPGVGKTTLATQLSKQLNIPLLSKDFFKETIFDASPELPWANETGTNALKSISYSLLYETVKVLLSKNISVIIESNFLVKYDASKITRLAEEYNAHTIEISCTAPDNIIRERTIQRLANNSRHPVHIETREGLSNSVQPIDHSKHKLNLHTQHCVDTLQPVNIHELAQVISSV